MSKHDREIEDMRVLVDAVTEMREKAEERAADLERELRAVKEELEYTQGRLREMEWRLEGLEK